MRHILFLLYTAVFGASFLVEGNDLFMAVGIMTGAAILYRFFRFVLFRRVGGYYARNYLSVLLCLAVLVPYMFFPDWVAAVICYAFMAGWQYVIPFLRLCMVRIIYMRLIKVACRRRNHAVTPVKGGLYVRTPTRSYDIRLVGTLRRTGVVTLTGETSFDLFWMPPFATENPESMRGILNATEGPITVAHRLLMGRKKSHVIQWSEGVAAERVLLFLPGLCEWKCNGGEQTLCNGSLRYGIRLYDADAFVVSCLDGERRHG